MLHIIQSSGMYCRVVWLIAIKVKEPAAYTSNKRMLTVRPKRNCITCKGKVICIIAMKAYTRRKMEASGQHDAPAVSARERAPLPIE